MKKDIYTRDGVKTIDQLKPFKMYGKKDDVIRYDFHHMTGIINFKLGFDVRRCQDDLVRLNFNIPIDEDSNKPAYCDFWHYQMDAIFKKEVRNDQCNSIYVGTPDKLDLKKLKKQPNDWQLFLLRQWNLMFSHLADKHGWIKVEVWW